MWEETTVYTELHVETDKADSAKEKDTTDGLNYGPRYVDFNYYLLLLLLLLFFYYLLLVSLLLLLILLL